MVKFITVIQDNLIEMSEDQRIRQFLNDANQQFPQRIIDPSWAHLVEKKLRIPEDALPYLKQDDEDEDQQVCWQKMYLDKIRANPEQAAELIAEQDSRKNMQIKVR